MLSPDDDLTCSDIRNFRQLLRSEICAANVCQSTKNTKQGYGNLDWGRIHWIYNMSAIDENRGGESMNPAFLGEIWRCKDEAKQFLRDNYGTIRQTVDQGAQGAQLRYVEFNLKCANCARRCMSL